MSPWKKQIGGEHYKKYAIQPTEYAEKNNLSFAEGCIVKYVTRWRDKGGVEDLKKIIHYAEILIDIEKNKTPTTKLACGVPEDPRFLGLIPTPPPPPPTSSDDVYHDIFTAGYASMSDNWYVTDNSALQEYWKNTKKDLTK